MKIEIKNVEINDIDRYNQCGMDGRTILAGHVKLIATDDDGNTGITYLEEKVVEKLGVAYIKDHITLTYSDICQEFFVNISQNDFKNDPTRNPARCVTVRFLGTKNGENTEVWQNTDSGCYYLRMLSNEPFARWMTCGGRSTGWVDRKEIRPNVTFMNAENGEIETVRYDDWNGTAAYSDTFNPNFRTLE